MVLVFSAAFIGLIHSLAPGHWLPVVLMSKSRRWSLKTALLGAAITALGHILLSLLFGLVAMWVGSHFFSKYELEIEQYSSLGLVVFGILYGLFAYFRHSSCRTHSHHGPSPENQNTPFLFLFTLGLSPCVAVIPVFAAASTEGSFVTVLTWAAFSCGVLVSLVGATLLVSKGLVKLDHPVFEHYGDVITGCGVALMGLFLFIFPGF